MEKIFIEHLSLIAKLKPSALAVAAGLAPSTLNRRTRDVVDMEYGLSNKSLRKIADHLELPIEDLVAHREKISAAIASKEELPSYAELSIPNRDKKHSLKHPDLKSRDNFPFGPDTVPILGQANASSKAVMLNFDDPIGEFPRHPNQKNVKNAYYVRIYDESMEPRYYPRELAAVNGNMSPLSKEDCVIQLKNGEVYIKRFIKTTSKEVICAQLNPAKEWKCLLTEVKAIHAVVGRG